MAQANTRSSSKQKRPTQGSNGSSASKRASASSSKSARSGGTSKNASGTSKNASGAASASKRRASASASNRASGASSGNGGSSKLPIIAGVATGAAGLIGGAVLGNRLAGSKPKRVLGIQVPGTGGGMDGLAKQVGKAAKQFKKASKQVGELTDEVRTAREKVEEVGRAFS